MPNIQSMLTQVNTRNNQHHNTTQHRTQHTTQHKHTRASHSRQRTRRAAPGTWTAGRAWPVGWRRPGRRAGSRSASRPCRARRTRCPREPMACERVLRRQQTETSSPKSRAQHATIYQTHTTQRKSTQESWRTWPWSDAGSERRPLASGPTSHDCPSPQRTVWMLVRLPSLMTPLASALRYSLVSLAKYRFFRLTLVVWRNS